VTAPWPWLVAAPARITGIVEITRDATDAELEAFRWAYKNHGPCGDMVIRRAHPLLPWRKRVARWRAR
jgi:hypothetical protein